jgi:hypothetical protein
MRDIAGPYGDMSNKYPVSDQSAGTSGRPEHENQSRFPLARPRRETPGTSRKMRLIIDSQGSRHSLARTQIIDRIPERLRKGLTHNFPKKSLGQIMNHADLYKEGTGGNFE